VAVAFLGAKLPPLGQVPKIWKNKKQKSIALPQRDAGESFQAAIGK
jgi:hypothetical protein